MSSNKMGTGTARKRGDAKNWNAEACGIVRAEIVRRNLTYKELAKLFEDKGIAETERSLANKISRGTFSFAFCLQLMYLLEVETLSVAPTTLVTKLLEEKGVRQF